MEKFWEGISILSSFSFGYLGYNWTKVLLEWQNKSVEDELRTYELAEMAKSSLNSTSLIHPNLLTLSATKLANLIISGQVTSETIVSAFISHLLVVNPYLNAVCDERYEEAINDAKKCDKILQGIMDLEEEEREEKLQKLKEEKPFFGVPYIAKECFEIPGMKYTAGIVGRAKHNIVGKNLCPAIGNVLMSGAIIIATGNVSEGCMWYESSNNVYGRTNNYYDLSRAVGGSSGGNCAIVSALGAPFAITSDVGGSTRIPCMYNGLFGHKPSGGSVSNIGTCPATVAKVNRFCQLGPSCRHSEDLFPLLKILSKEIAEQRLESLSPKEKETLPYLEKYPWMSNSNGECLKFDKNTKVLVMWEQPGSIFPVSGRDNSQIEAQKRVVNAFKDNGNEIIEVNFEGMRMAFDMWSALMLDESEVEFIRIISQGKAKETKLLDPGDLSHEIHGPYELLKHIFSLGEISDHTLPALALAVIDKIGKRFTPKAASDSTKDAFYKMRNEMMTALEGNTILLCPSLPTPAPKHGPIPLLLRFADVACTCIFNVLEFPVTQVPLGLNSQNLPTGIEVVGGMGKDDLTISTACFLEKVGVAFWEQSRR